MATSHVARWIKRRYLDLRILLRYGTFNPTVVTLADGRHQVIINPHDPRARKKVASDSIRRKRRTNQVFWAKAINRLQPDLALDVGVNFGECLFQSDYPDHTRAIGVDGNPELLPYLRESRELHPQSEQIEVHNALVDAQPGEPRTFYVQSKASGGSTASAAVAEMRDSDFREVTVPVTSIDDIVSQHSASPQRVVFKIDTEGYEPNVLRGMETLLSGCEVAVGFIEFDPRMLVRSGEDVAGYWQRLQDHFDVHMFFRGSVIPVSGTDWSTIAPVCAQIGDHTDLLLTGGTRRGIAHQFVAECFPIKPLARAA